MSPEFGFYSAIDADSEGVEGRFYVWSKQEVDELLGEASVLFCKFYDITEKGNWEHVNILRIKQPVEVFAQQQNLNVNEAIASLERCRRILLNHRNIRVRPSLDDKILLSWNALMNIAYSKAYAALGDPHYKTIAEKNIAFMESKMQNGDDGFYHTYKNNIAKIPAFLNDYANLIQAYIALQEITGEADYLFKAKKLTELVLKEFSEEAGFFYFTQQSQTDVIVRKKEVYDGATPSGNAVMAYNLLQLAKFFDKREWEERVLFIIESLGTAIVRYPTSFGVWASVLQQIVYGIKEIVITGAASKQQLLPVLQQYIPNKIMQSATISHSGFPLLEGKDFEVEAAFYLCQNYNCHKPVFNLEEFLEII
jgi:uncharacterized protein YyaL (SSP411 family)